MKPAKNPTASEMGKRGAAALNGSLTPEQRRESARRAARARWDAARKLFRTQNQVGPVADSAVLS